MRLLTSSKVVMGSAAPQEASKNPIKLPLKTRCTQAAAVTQQDAYNITTHTCLIISYSLHKKMSSATRLCAGCEGNRELQDRNGERRGRKNVEKINFFRAFKKENRKSFVRARVGEPAWEAENKTGDETLFYPRGKT